MLWVLLSDIHTDRAADFTARGMLKMDLIDKWLDMWKKLERMGKWEIKDQLKILVAMEEFMDEVEPIVDKYDDAKPKESDVKPKKPKTNSKIRSFRRLNK